MVKAIYHYSRTGSFKFQMIKLTRLIISFLFIIMFLIPKIIMILLKRSASNADEVAGETQTKLSIHSALSFFTWQTAEEVYAKLVDQYSSKKEIRPDGTIVTSDEAIDTDSSDILGQLILETGHLCEMRQENKKEYTTRRLAQKYGPELSTKELAEEETAERELACERFEEEFDLITDIAGENILKGLYWGRDILFLKKEIGEPTEEFSAKSSFLAKG